MIFDQNKSNGQALLEFILSYMIIVPTIILCLLTLKDLWEKTQCAHFVFEQVHAQLIGRQLSKAKNITIQFYETQESIKGIGICGHFKETITLPKLQSAQWP